MSEPGTPNHLEMALLREHAPSQPLLFTGFSNDIEIYTPDLVVNPQSSIGPDWPWVHLISGHLFNGIKAAACGDDELSSSAHHQPRKRSYLTAHAWWHGRRFNIHRFGADCPEGASRRFSCVVANIDGERAVDTPQFLLTVEWAISSSGVQLPFDVSYYSSR